MPLEYRLPFARLLATAAAALVLSACDSPEEKAEEYYQSAVALAESGDYERAQVELRNALQFDELHLDARRLLSRLAFENGDVNRGYRELLRVVEAEPNDLVARQKLAETAILTQAWDEAERHGDFLLAQVSEGAEAPERTEIIDLSLRFREAAQAGRQTEFDGLIAEAEELRDRYPGNEVLQRLLIEGYMRQGQPDDALEIVDEALETRPDDAQFNRTRLGILAANDDLQGLEQELRRQLEVFPEDIELRGQLVRLLASTGRGDEAADFMRSLIDDTEAGLGALVSLAAYVRSTEGIDAAIAEIDAARDKIGDADQIEALRAGLLFDRGDRDEGIAAMEALIAQSEEGDMANRWKIALAQMLIASGNEVGARGLVEEVRAVDPTMPAAVRLSAAWQIEADETGQAIADLRAALEEAPNDPALLTLLAQAHQRAGEPSLAQEMLSLAAESSGFAPAESLRYADLLVRQDSLRAAEDTLLNSLRRTPNNLDVLSALAQIYLREDDFARATQVEETLRRIESEEARVRAEDLKLRIIAEREGREAATAHIENLVRESGDDISARVALIRARLANGENDEALTIAQSLADEMEQGGDASRALQLMAATRLAAGELEAAEADFSQIVEEDPSNVRSWLQLVRLQIAGERMDEAEATLQTALDANPDAPDLLWAKASRLEQEGDIDGAIAIYEGLYERMSGSPIVANNLASLLVTYRDDDESLERAATVAARLRGTEVPPFQDTYGWILYRQGKVDEALEYLRPAAEALSTDPIVQYHLGRALRDAGETEAALEAFRKAVEVAPENDEREQIADARAAIEALEAQ